MNGSNLAVMAWRNLWRNRRRTIITLCSITFGMMLAIMFTGIGDSSWTRMINLAARSGDGHVTFQHPEYLDTPSLTKTITNVDALVETALKDKQDGNFTVNVYGQWFDCLICFDIFGRTNDAVDSTTRWFEEFMMENTGFLLSMGVSKLTYWDRKCLDPLGGIRNDIPRRRVRYFMREETLFEKRVRSLQEIQVILEKLNNII